MKHIGLLMIREENDILERTLAHNAEFVDCFYVLDGTVPNDESRAICEAHAKCDGYWTDGDVSSWYGDTPCDGWRGFLLEHAYADHGYHNWFVLLHGDEVWTEDPRKLTARTSFASVGFIYHLPFFFPRAGEEWDESEHPIDQLRWNLSPGWPELRVFRGSPNVRYKPSQHFNVCPEGINLLSYADAPILHYPYRSPSVQRDRAHMHEQTGFDPDNYRHILNSDAVYWTDSMIDEYRSRPQFKQLGCASRNPVGV